MGGFPPGDPGTPYRIAPGYAFYPATGLSSEAFPGDDMLTLAEILSNRRDMVWLCAGIRRYRPLEYLRLHSLRLSGSGAKTT